MSRSATLSMENFLRPCGEQRLRPHVSTGLNREMFEDSSVAFQTRYDGSSGRLNPPSAHDVDFTAAPSLYLAPFPCSPARTIDSPRSCNTHIADPTLLAHITWPPPSRDLPPPPPRSAHQRLAHRDLLHRHSPPLPTRSHHRLCRRLRRKCGRCHPT